MAAAAQAISSWPAAKSARVWIAFNQLVDSWSRRFAALAHTLLLREGRRASAAYESGGERAAIESVRPAEWHGYISRLWLTIVPVGAEFTEARLIPSLAPKATAPNNIWVAAARQWIMDNAGARAADLSATSQAFIADQIRIGVSKGESTAQVAARITKRYKSISPGRAATIARTEVHAAANYGSLVMIEQSNVPARKIWISTPDGRTRDAHRAANQQSQAIADPFQVGGYPMMHPGDSTSGAPPSLTCNCRCVMNYTLTSRPVRERPRRPRRAA